MLTPPLSPRSPRALGFVGITLLLLCAASPLAARAVENDPSFFLRSESQSLTFRRSDLLKRDDVTAIHVDQDPAYDGKPHDYTHTVPLRALFSGVSIPANSTLQFECQDGFSAPLSKERLLDSVGSTPYIAFEGPGETWPNGVANKNPRPFYLIWKDPEKSHIGTEEWPFSL